MKKNYLFPLFLISLIFFAFGFITWVNGVLIPYFKICLELSNFEALLVAFATYISFFLFAIPSSLILKRTGYKKGIVIGLVIMGIGALTFIPAAYTRTYGLFLTGIFITASGMVLLQSAANPFVAIIGPVESTAQRIGFMGLANKFAGILAQMILGGILLFNADSITNAIKVNPHTKEQLLDNYALRVVNPYIIIACVFLVMAVAVYHSGLPEINDTEANAVKGTGEKKNILQFPHLVFGALTLFFASACEVIPVDAIILYSKALGIPLEISKHYGAYTLYAMLGGYLATTVLIPKFLSQRKALGFCGVAGMMLTLAAFFTKSFTSVYFVISMGFITAWLWGTIWGLSLNNLGRFTKTGAAILLMALVGGALTPLLFGHLIDININYPQNAILMLIPCYIVIFWYALYGSKIQSWKRKYKLSS